MFKERIEYMFTITDVKKDGHCEFASVVSYLNNLNTCNDNMTHRNLRREMSKLLVQGTKSIPLFKALFPAFCDIDSGHISQTL